MAGASPGPSINRGPTTIDGQRPSQRRIVVAPLAGAMPLLCNSAQLVYAAKHLAIFSVTCHNEYAGDTITSPVCDPSTVLCDY